MAKGDTVYGAHSDNVNQVYGILGVIGTLGTADVNGTANTLPIGVNETTGAMYVQNLGGTTTIAGNIGTVGTVSAGTITRILGGTITNSGTVTGVGTIANIAKIHNAGTIVAGTIDKVTMLFGGTINASTVNSSTINAGTIDKVTMLFGGTINASTINAGTFKNDGRVARNVLTYSTTVALAGSAYGTIIGSASVGAGTYLWVNDISLLGEAGTTTYAAGFGTWNQGTSVLVRGQFGPNSGIQKSYPLAVNAGMTNQDLTVWSNAASTVDVSVSYFISA